MTGHRIVVIGGGISGLAAAYALQEGAAGKGIPIELTILEQEERPGGKIRSVRDQGFLCEYGPNGFLDNKPATLEFCRRLGVDGRLLRSRDEARRRFIYSGGKLHRLPESPPAFFLSRLLSMRGRLRMIGELFAKKAPEGVDETLADFARRRLGQEALDKLIAPMVSGIFAGDPETMSLKSCFPRIAELEAQYGSLIRAMIHLQRAKKRQGNGDRSGAGPAGPGGVLTSFEGGLEDLVHSLQAALAGGVRTSSGVTALEKGQGDSPYRIHLSGQGGTIETDVVILAVPAYVASGILGGIDPDCRPILDRIPYAPLSVICMGYPKKAIPMPVDGFGFLIPDREGIRILGTLWDSSIFPGRAPEGYVSLRSMAGGARHPEYGLFSEEKVLANTRKELKKIMGISSPPDFVRIFRHEKAIPQYVVGHAEAVRKLERIVSERHAGLFLTGNAFHGIGINDCVASAECVAERVLEFLTRE